MEASRADDDEEDLKPYLDVSRRDLQIYTSGSRRDLEADLRSMERDVAEDSDSSQMQIRSESDLAHHYHERRLTHCEGIKSDSYLEERCYMDIKSDTDLSRLYMGRGTPARFLKSDTDIEPPAKELEVKADLRTYLESKIDDAESDIDEPIVALDPLPHTQSYLSSDEMETSFLSVDPPNWTCCRRVLSSDNIWTSELIPETDKKYRSSDEIIRKRHLIIQMKKK